MESVVVARNLVKVVGGRCVLEGVTFFVRRGEVYGLIGPNGAGKTTTLRIVVGLLKPTAGSVTVLGLDPVRDAARLRRKVGYLPEDAGVYERLTGYEHLLYRAWLHTGNRSDAERLAEEGVRMAGLGDAIHRQAGGYSRGMKRKLLLALVLMTRPELVVLDEPTSGLDVYSSVKVRDMIKRYIRESGSSAIVSSHNMLEVEYLCDRVAFIERGRIVAEGTPGELKERFSATNLEEAFVKAIRGGLNA